MNHKLVIALLGLSFCMQGANLKISVQNPNAVAVKDAPVVVVLKNYTSFKTDERNHLTVMDNGKQLRCELDDLDKDGIADELVFLLDMKPGEVRKLDIATIADKDRLNFPAEVYADMIKKDEKGEKHFVTEASSTKNDMYTQMHHHGVAFESALIAYRIYFDNKSTIDMYGKKKQQLELATTGWYPTDEQATAGYGDDNIRVFSTVGVGTVKGWDGTKAIHIENFEKRTQRIVAAGKLRTVCEWEVKGWQYEGKKIDITARYILYARHRDAICEVRASENINNLCTGVQTIAGGPTLITREGLVGSWGTDFPVTDTIKYAKQTTAFGVFVPQPYAGKQITEGANNLILMPYKKGEVLRFYLTAAAGKEIKNPFTSANQFFDYLKKWKQTLQPVVVK